MNERFARAIYQARNWRARWRALLFGSSRRLDTEGRLRMEGVLTATLIKADGRRIDLGVLSRRLVTDVGVTYMRDDFNAATGSADITNFNYHDSGTGTTAEAVGDTDLVTPAGPATRATGTQSAPAANQYRSVGTIAYTGVLAITEHGLFQQASRSGVGTLWDRSVFTAIAVISGDSIQFTDTLTITSGG